MHWDNGVSHSEVTTVKLCKSKAGCVVCGGPEGVMTHQIATTSHAKRAQISIDGWVMTGVSALCY